MTVTWRILQGDVCERLASLPAESVQTCVTSPPYWGLRDYGTATWDGGDPSCDHDQRRRENDGNSKSATSAGQTRDSVAGRTTCRKCGARRIDAQIGLEPTPSEYVTRMVEVFAEVHRVLREDGTLWLNLGSSYASGDTAASQSRRPSRAPAYGIDGKELLGSLATDSACSDLCGECSAALSSRRNASTDQPSGQEPPPHEQTSRDTEPAGSAVVTLCASPLVAQESTMRQSSPQPLGECSHCRNCGACLSVLRSASRDARLCARMAARTGDTAQHESGVRMIGTDVSGTAWLNYTYKHKDLVPIPWLVAIALQQSGWYLRSEIIWHKPNPMPESVTDRPTKSHEQIFLFSKSARYYYDAEAIMEEAVSTGAPRRDPGGTDGYVDFGMSRGRAGNRGDGTRNKRSVWTVPTQPYPEAHFATYPEALIEPCILAGTSERGQCPACGAPWERVVEREAKPSGRSGDDVYTGQAYATPQSAVWGSKRNLGGDPRPTETIGWQPSCECHAGDPVPQLVLDPFTGSGTTGAVAIRHQRSFVGTELNPAYIDLARRRIGDVAPLLASEVA